MAVLVEELRDTRPIALKAGIDILSPVVVLDDRAAFAVPDLRDALAGD